MPADFGSLALAIVGAGVLWITILRAKHLTRSTPEARRRRWIRPTPLESVVLLSSAVVTLACIVLIEWGKLSAAALRIWLIVVFVLLANLLSRSNDQ